MSLSVIIVTSGRSTLLRTLQSVSRQLHADDEVLVVGRGASIRDQAEAFGFRYVEDGPFGNWGQRERQSAMAHATKSHLLFNDDDDYYMPGAFDAVRAAIDVHPDSPLMFKMITPEGRLIWSDPIVTCGNVSGQQFVVPNDPQRLGTWGLTHEGDLAFIESTLSLYPANALMWHSETIVGCRDQVRRSSSMKKILWVGDGPDCPSGFGRATRKIVEFLDYRQRGAFDVTVLGINHRGDPSTVPYPVYVAGVEGDAFGVNRIAWMCDVVEPDLIVLQNDGWNIPAYVQRVRLLKEYNHVPIVASVAVDGKNFRGEWLNGVALAIFWTQFALTEANFGGYDGPSAVIPLGVDLDIYNPMDKQHARLARGLPRMLDDAFIVGCVNRNQPRKRWDLLIKYFAEWAKPEKIQDAWLYLHIAPTKDDDGIDVEQLAKYYGVLQRLALIQTRPWYGVSELEMRDTYNCFDVYASTTLGEGFGLPALEAMACGVPCVLPDWSAFGEWGRRGAWLVPCKSTAISLPRVNVIGGVPDQTAFMLAMNRLYIDKKARAQNSDAALECAQQPAFRWENIGERWIAALEHVMTVKEELVGT